jgi:hypothetical protein
MYLTAAMTGMRQGELFALRRRDVMPQAIWQCRLMRLTPIWVRQGVGRTVL